MSRVERKTIKRYIVFCEGDTEYNYVNGMKKIQNTKNEIALKPIPLDRGGFKSFLNTIKESTDTNCIAKFVFIDYDRVLNNTGEKKCLEELISYCKNQNTKNKIPYFIILSNPNFDYLSCLHSSEYKEGDISSFITSNKGFKFKNMDEYKSKDDIYIFLNSHGNSMENMRNKLKNKRAVLKNTYTIKKKDYLIKITNTEVCFENDYIKCSNINEFFDILNW